MTRAFTLFIAVLSPSFSTVYGAGAADDPFTIDSRVLDEIREYRVSLPSSYENSGSGLWSAIQIHDG